MGGTAKKICEEDAQRGASVFGIVEKVKAVDQALPSLLALTGDDSCVSHLSQVEAMLESGVRFIQFRSKLLTGASLIEEARIAADLARQVDAVLIVNDSPEVADRSGAHGVHLGMKDASLASACELMGDMAIIGRTVHTVEEARQVKDEGRCGYVGLGPFRSSKTKPGLRPVLEYPDLSEIKAILEPIPIFLIGGLGLADFDLIDDLGIAGLAVCSALSVEGRFGANLKAFVERARSFEPVEVSS
jgi:thiamine-phosphate pyrophosphorylase